MLRKIILFGLVLLLSGCATTMQKAEFKSKIKPGEQIGILIETSDQPIHNHIGTLVFNNFVKTYPYPWALQSSMTTSFSKPLTDAGYKVVDLRAAGFDAANLSGLLEEKNGNWVVAKDKEAIVAKLRDTLNLKMVVVAKQSRSLASLECSGGPCSSRYIDASGLFTRSIFGIDAYFAVAALSWNIYTFSPYEDVAEIPPFKEMLWRPSSIMRGFKTPANFKELSEAELAPVREVVLSLVSRVGDEIVKGLNSESTK